MPVHNEVLMTMAMWKIGCIFIVLLPLALCSSLPAVNDGNKLIGKCIIHHARNKESVLLYVNGYVKILLCLKVTNAVCDTCVFSI